jgi:hypothetical protein
VQPRAEPGTTLETADVARHRQQGVLARLFGVLVVRKDAAAMPQHVGLDPPQQLAECPVVALRGVAGQLLGRLVQRHSGPHQP